MKRLLASIVALLLLAVAPAFADCTTPSGFTRWGAGNWRITETMPGACAWQRLPCSGLPSDISTAIKDLAKDSTGIGIHITSNTDTLRICWELAAGTASYSLTSQTGASGVDVYFRPAGTNADWDWLAVGEAVNANNNETNIALGSSASREFLITLPSYRKIGLIRIETVTGATLSAGPAPADDPFVFYGSSIDQGTGSSRPGIVADQRVARHFKRDGINLGFAGSCQMTAGMAGLIAGINASAYVIDCFPNMTPAQITADMYTFVSTIAAAHPSIPVVISQDRLNTTGGPHPSLIQRQIDNYNAFSPIITSLQGVYSNVYYMPATGIFGKEGALDGSHPTDIGQWNRGEAWISFLTPLL